MSYIRLERHGIGDFTYLDVGRWTFTFWPRRAWMWRKWNDQFVARLTYGVWVGPLWIGRSPR